MNLSWKHWHVTKCFKDIYKGKVVYHLLTSLHNGVIYEHFNCSFRKVDVWVWQCLEQKNKNMSCNIMLSSCMHIVTITNWTELRICHNGFLHNVGSNNTLQSQVTGVICDTRTKTELFLLQLWYWSRKWWPNDVFGLQQVYEKMPLVWLTTLLLTQKIFVVLELSIYPHFVKNFIKTEFNKGVFEYYHPDFVFTWEMYHSD